MLRRTLLAAPALLLPGLALAQPRVIRLIVPFAAGGAADSAARTLAPRMGERLGQTIVVENRTGASGSVGGGAVAQAAPDGQTLLWDASSHLVNPALLRGLPFDYATAFTPISLVTTFPQVLAVKAESPARDLAGFIAMAKQQPGRLNIGTQGNATAGHLAVVQLQRLAGINLQHVPYRGGADAARDLAGGNLDAAFITALSAGPVVASGRARFLAIAAEQRVAVQPDVPTFAEAGLPGLTLSEWAALFGPAGLPAPLVERLHGALKESLAEPEVQARLAQLAAVPVGSSPSDFARFVREGRESMATLVREADIRLD
ncbi:tripartite tricarboxylate transporter substrate binding protein [Pseudoroseomonas cervicalis]|uniref:Bug family tripartite tricarboxylate transporter substrate binding protein n=1 Tax=Teichococcus cervicalis TaxID=204525 RepID=UPI0027832B8E|nr:tripartite tricarboxylate transporter substrate-binding protein [Pseudoroseomonas cervicalis]MDQ1081070.1 tripartite-type tricarboxylate transporter receptor subunit TctC [Pseudoroseomonas cervicalis]